MKKNNLPIYLAIALIIGIGLGTLLSIPNYKLSLGSNDKEIKIKQLIHHIQEDYVDTIDTEALLDDAIKSMVNKLDPHSIYIPKENVEQINQSMEGNFVGIGVQFRIINDTITVIQPIEGGPSIKKGILAGDRILEADNDTLYGKSIASDKVIKKLKGVENSKVNLKIYRKTIDSTFNVEVNRGRVNIKSIDVAYIIKDSIGYIKIDRFAKNTYAEFKNSLNRLQDKGLTDLILDLRNNGGGFVYTAKNILDEFLEDGKLLFFIKNNKGEVKKYFATEKGNFEKGNLYVLIDENSASASEIVAGALQDNDKGTIIGRRSFGKGLVQNEINFKDGSALRLTTQRYYTPTGRCIQKPYTNKAGRKDNNSYNNEINERMASGELMYKDSIKIIDSLKFKTPKGKIVYGGGGIIPDIFVPIQKDNYFPRLYLSILNDFAFKYVDENRLELSKNTLNQFIENFDQDKKVYNKLINRFKVFTTNDKQKTQLYKYLKIIIAGYIYGDTGRHKVKSLNDSMIQKVVEIKQQQTEQ